MRESTPMFMVTCPRCGKDHFLLMPLIGQAAELTVCGCGSAFYSAVGEEKLFGFEVPRHQIQQAWDELHGFEESPKPPYS